MGKDFNSDRDDGMTKDNNLQKAIDIIDQELTGSITSAGTIAFRGYFGENVAMSLREEGILPEGESSTEVEYGVQLLNGEYVTYGDQEWVSSGQVLEDVPTAENVVQRTITTYTGEWKACTQPYHNRKNLMAIRDVALKLWEWDYPMSMPLAEGDYDKLYPYMGRAKMLYNAGLIKEETQ